MSKTVLTIPASHGSIELTRDDGSDRVAIAIHGQKVSIETEKLLKHLAALCDCYVLPREIKGRVVNG